MPPKTNKLSEIITKHIKQNGPMPLGKFIEYAMTHPEYGYYTNNDPLGSAGDFTTAPEISQIFGELIGAWAVDVWMQLGQPDFNLVECGPGRGTLMADIMRIGSNVKGFTECANIHLIETQSVLRDKQKGSLSTYNVTWHENLSGMQSDRPCIITGNEFLDALPIEQLVRDSNGWNQKAVALDDETQAFIFSNINADKDLTVLLPPKTESNQTYEVSPARMRFMEGCAEMVSSHGGAALFIDYGHSQSHYGDTLQAVKDHRFSDVLNNIGGSDITSHVDFDALCRCIGAFDVATMPITPQGRFLQMLGVNERAEALTVHNMDKKGDIMQGVNRLTAKEQMGDLFKVMCFYNGSIRPCGFE